MAEAEAIRLRAVIVALRAELAEARAEAAAKQKAEEEAAAKQKAEEEAAARQKAEEEAAARKKAEEEAAAKTKAEEEAAAKKKAEEEATEVFPTAHPPWRGFFFPLPWPSIAAEVLQHGHRTGQQPRSSALESYRQNTTLLYSRPTPTQLAAALCVALERCEVAEAEAVVLRAEIVALRAELAEARANPRPMAGGPMPGFPKPDKRDEPDPDWKHPFPKSKSWMYPYKPIR